MQENKLEFLSEVSRAIEELLDPKEAFETVFDLVARIIHFRYATLYGFSEKEGQLVPVAYRRKVVDLIPSIKFSAGNGLSAWVAAKKKPILLSRIHTSPQLTHRVVKSFISVPFIWNKELIGVLNLGHSIPGAFTMDELELAIKVADELSGLLHHYLLLNDLYALDLRYKRLKQRLTQDETRRISHQDEIINQLSKAVSHHINNPLTAIMGNAQLLLSDFGNVGIILKDRLQKIIDESDRISKVIESLRNLERIDYEDYLPGEKMIKLNIKSREVLRKVG
jgi:signal transduction histidine kinase